MLNNFFCLNLLVDSRFYLLVHRWLRLVKLLMLRWLHKVWRLSVHLGCFHHLFTLQLLQQLLMQLLLQHCLILLAPLHNHRGLLLRCFYHLTHALLLGRHLLRVRFGLHWLRVVGGAGGVIGGRVRFAHVRLIFDVNTQFIHYEFWRLI